MTFATSPAFDAWLAVERTQLGVYSSPSVERVKAHAKAAGLPADEVFDLVTDVDPANL
jgi:hypothetical protein